MYQYYGYYLNNLMRLFKYNPGLSQPIEESSQSGNNGIFNNKYSAHYKYNIWGGISIF